MSQDIGHSQIVLDPETATAIKIAYSKATARFQGDRYSDLRKIIGKRLAAAAQAGERDPGRLCKTAMQSIGFHG
jgi:hypothetical protein